MLCVFRTDRAKGWKITVLIRLLRLLAALGVRLLTGKKLFLQQEVPPLSSTNHSAVRSLCDRKEIARGRSPRGWGLAPVNMAPTVD
jgi:hypothetical protein